jgi:uncharacterized membrane protein YdfJ with MMPL/SSD domain
MAFAALVSVTLAPALMTLFVRGAHPFRARSIPCRAR